MIKKMQCDQVPHAQLRAFTPPSNIALPPSLQLLLKTIYTTDSQISFVVKTSITANPVFFYNSVVNHEQSIRENVTLSAISWTEGLEATVERSIVSLQTFNQKTILGSRTVPFMSVLPNIGRTETENGLDAGHQAFGKSYLAAPNCPSLTQSPGQRKVLVHRNHRSLKFNSFVTTAVVLVALTKSVHSFPISVQPRAAVECVTATWQDVLLFFLVNYVTHAMTVKALPGETVGAEAFYKFVALFLPFTGAWRGLRAIRLATVFGEDELQRAARAGALCIVARSKDWRPGNEEIQGCTVKGELSYGQTRSRARFVVQMCPEAMVPIRPTDVRVHGQYSLPQGYCLVRLPENATVCLEHNAPLDIASSHSTVKMIMSIIQLGFACSTLYRARGTQLEQYWYAAFSLTILPYTIMSFINLVGNIVTPDYSTFYIVRSEVMEEAKGRGGKFDGTIGVMSVNMNHDKEQVRGNDVVSFDGSDSETGMAFYKELKRCNLVPSYFNFGPLEIEVPSMSRYLIRPKSVSERRMTIMANVLVVVAILAPYAVIAVFTRFDSGTSTSNQRIWTMSWLVVGQVAGIFLAAVMNLVDDCGGRMVLLISSVMFILPAIGGLVTVAEMIKGFGLCSMFADNLR